MSSFPQHEINIRKLAAMGFDVSDLIEDGNSTIESWKRDDLTYLIEEIIQEMENQNFKVKAT